MKKNEILFYNGLNVSFPPRQVNQLLSKMLSVYIPVILSSMATEEFVKENFKINKIGTVSHVDFVFNGTKYSAYVHFSEWENNPTATAFINQLASDVAYRLYFDYPADYEYKTGYWICLKNKSSKTNHQTPKVRIDVSGLKEEDDNAWMDELMENDADTESEAWDFMMEELAKEEEHYVRSLEEEVAHLRHIAFNATNAWNHERTQLLNSIAHLESVANELYLVNRSLSGFLQHPTQPLEYNQPYL